MSQLTDTNSFEDMTPEEEDSILRNLVSTSGLLDIDGLYAMAILCYSDDIREAWAERNNRCTDCGARLDGNCDCR